MAVRGTRREFQKKMAALPECELCFDVVAVLPAGGSGVRMNIQRPKQVRNLTIFEKLLKILSDASQTTVIYLPLTGIVVQKYW